MMRDIHIPIFLTIGAAFAHVLALYTYDPGHSPDFLAGIAAGGFSTWWILK